MCLGVVLISTCPGEKLFPVVKKKREKKGREEQERTKFGMCADERAIREELSLFSHENDYFSLIF